MQVLNKLFKACFLLPALIIGWVQVFAHPMPNSKGGIKIQTTQLKIQISTPVSDLEIAFGKNINLDNRSSKQELEHYYLRHFSIKDRLEAVWDIRVDSINAIETADSIMGSYKEFTASLTAVPSKVESLRDFQIVSDLIIHQIPNQAILFSIDQDWENGIDAYNTKEVGVISLDIPSGKILPLSVKMEKGTWWKGFVNMFGLGMSHIKEGTDHLMFLLTLLIAACFVSFERKWVGFGGLSYSLKNIVRIVTAFTIGHSITLILGTLQILRFPSTVVEVLIALSILVSALHAIKPLFPKREQLIAGIFGLIHGAAFASTLIDLNLDGRSLTLSLLGFNLGIEAMQLFIVLLVLPSILLFCYSSSANEFRLIGGILVSIASIGWLIQRLQGKDNFITKCCDQVTQYPVATVTVLFGGAVITFLLSKAVAKIKLA